MLRETFSVLRDLPRVREISAVFVRNGLGDLVHRLGIPAMFERAGQILHVPVEPGDEPIPAPVRVRLAFEALGPTFVKLGQVLATRVDVFPQDWITEFEKLQTNVPGIPFEQLEADLQKAIGMPLDQVFRQLDRTPIGAASIAQVHRATLFTGEEVILKIRRPGIISKIEADLRILHHIAALVEFEWPDLRRYHPVSIVEQFSRSLHRELDLSVEARNVDRFRRNFECDPRIVVPGIHWEWTSEIVNVQEYIDGIPGNELKRVDQSGLDRKELAAIGADAVLKMILIDGYFHADPHPGNVFYLEGGRIAFIDFGMVGRLPHYRRDQIVDLLAALANRDEQGILDVILDWSGDVVIDEEKLAADIADFIFDYEYLPLKDIRIGALLNHMISIMREHTIALPPDLTLLFKALITLEGLGRQLDPEFEMVAHMTPFVREVVIDRYRPSSLLRRIKHEAADTLKLLSSAPRDIGKLLKEIRRGKVKIDFDLKRLDHFGIQLNRAANRLTLGIVTGCLIIASAIVMTVPSGPRLWGMSMFGFMGFFIAFLNSIWIIFSIWRSAKD
ncbi:ubiquinone biosynthesis protein [Chitinivorax tropicus]|uniref:Ubiquinone biosynthesis protein n=1 Tax=Chitinivorax tropicus TaxID=714531 RepID=A0A840MRU1_9PROT|nr:AarF/UbiB family protein [Chitinivorax tropicus]MBB5019799.1 ubiquinone biosynthesis protein [Chitinivorax tropicus]